MGKRRKRIRSIGGGRMEDDGEKKAKKRSKNTTKIKYN